ncbi:MAG: superoxide dismutase, partial [Rhabdaerophilum sp.]
MNAHLSRRFFLAGSAVALTLPATHRVYAQAAAAPAGPYATPKLGYAFNALEPHIDAMTMEIHSQRH